MYDVAIIGAGPAGYVAALRCSQLGANVALIEKEALGGVCLNKGCIPTKTLLASAELLSGIKRAADFGITTGGVSVDFARMMQRKKEVILKLRAGIGYLLAARKVKIFEGSATLLSPTKIKVGGEEAECKNVILATGSRPAEVPGLNLDHKDILSSDDLLEIEKIPERLVIIGGGVIGCEFATLFRELGAEVTIVEMAAQLLPNEDKEIAKYLESSLKKKGIKIFTNTKVGSVRREGEKLSVFTSGDLSKGEFTKEIEASKILLSVGRTPNTEHMGSEGTGVQLNGKYIKVNDYLQTDVPNIYAIGDVIGGYLLAHVASHEGMRASENIFGKEPQRIDYRFVPNCIYTDPEIATVGISEDKAKKDNLAYDAAKFPFAALGKARAMGREDGFLKLIAEKGTQKLLGCQIIGPRATDLIAEAALACKCALTVQEVAETIHAHPTLSEAVSEAALKISNSPVHIL